ncbi:MAG: deoxyribose-phosphate aldolase [Actinomycetota bacterium]|nr:deoxyribose-phosphate aldolase [Actinomycetota bacterium]
MSIELARHIQHTLIGPGVSRAQIERHVGECTDLGFDAAMVGACWVREVRELLSGSAVKVATAVDFPYGCMTTDGRIAEMRAVVDAGADEVDIGVQVGWLRSGELARFSDDLARVVAAAEGVPVKVMLELPLLGPDERRTAVEASVAAGARFVKNASSGAVGVATPEDIAWLRSQVPPGVGVKASGGISSAEQATALIVAGADLLGTSTGVQIVRGGAGDRSY